MALIYLLIQKVYKCLKISLRAFKLSLRPFELSLKPFSGAKLAHNVLWCKKYFAP